MIIQLPLADSRKIVQHELPFVSIVGNTKLVVLTSVAAPVSTVYTH